MTRRLRVDPYAVLVFLVPIFQIALNQNLFFTAILARWIDTWVYTGYFLSFPEHLKEFAGTYYGTRLPWILPGYFFHSFFPPVPANLLLHLIFYYALLYSVYLIFKWNVGRAEAFWVCMLIAWNPFVLLSVGWDYVDGPGIVFIALVLCFIEAGLRSARKDLWATLVGVGAACLLYVNTFLGMTWPLLAFYAWSRNNSASRRSVGRAALSVTAGFLITTAVFGAVNHAFGGDFLFFKGSFAFAYRISKAHNPWLPKSGWYFRDLWLLLPSLIFTSTLIFLWRQRKGFRPLPVDFFRGVQYFFLSFFVLWAGLQLLGQPVLSEQTYGSYLSLFAAMALGAQVFHPGSGLAGASSAKRVFFLGLVLLVFALPYVFDSGPFWDKTLIWLQSRRWVGEIAEDKEPVHILKFVSAAAIGVLLLSCLYAIRRPFLRAASVFLCVSAVYFSIQMPDHFFIAASSQPSSRACFDAVCRIHRYLKTRQDGKQFRFWYNDGSLKSGFFRSIAGTFLWGYRLLGEDYPRLLTEPKLPLDAGKRIVVLGWDVKDLEEGRRVLAAAGVSTTKVGEEWFDIQGGRKAVAVLLDVK